MSAFGELAEEMLEAEDMGYPAPSVCNFTTPIYDSQDPIVVRPSTKVSTLPERLRENLPTALQKSGLFCEWAWEEDKNRPGKRKKVPKNPRTGNGAQSTNPNTFTSFDTAIAAYNRGGYDGLGVGVFGSLGAIDIDHCIDENGTVSAMAQDIVQTMNSYAEFSPSGHGIRILFTVRDDFKYDKDRFYIFGDIDLQITIRSVIV